MKKLLMLVALSSLLGACAQEEREEVAATAVDAAVAAPVRGDCRRRGGCGPSRCITTRDA